MFDKSTFKFNMPETNAYIVVIGILSLILLYFNIYIGTAIFILFVYIVFHNWRSRDIRRKEWNKYIQDLAVDIDEVTKKAILNLPIPLCILEFDGSITWYNTKFHEMTDKEDTLGMNIETLVKNIDLRKVLNENKELYTDINYKDRNYTIVYNVVKSDQENKTKYLMMLYWIDKTEYLNLKTKYNEEQNVVATIQVDGYEEVLQSAPEERRPLMNVEIDKILASLEVSCNGALEKTAKDKYFLVLSKSELDKLEFDKFSILDKIREIDQGNTLPVTISMGIGIEGKTINENFKLAKGALDLALGRGGDQAVIKTKDRSIFYGGKSKAVEKKTKVKSRLIGHALREIILESKDIYIMGHKYPDMDAMGAAVGIYDICKSCNKGANIVLNNTNDSIDEFIKRVKSSDYYPNIFVNKDEAIKNCAKDTLVIVVDTHRPNFTECPELLEISDKVVVIDHHRRGVEFINDTVLLFHETYVSSTCEMVTELVQYMEDDVKINKLTAEGLMAGISLDTKNFAFKTGVRTFEAASYLKKAGADTIEVKKLFNSNLKDFIAKAEIMQSTKVINNKICLAYCKADINNINVVVAQAADELLSIKDVEASFVLGKTKSGTIFISARSLGSINVHVLMEKLGGGGHIDIAGAQLENVSLEEGYKMVSDIIKQYLEEEEE
ncbi:MAG: DHH family phosphoesterase [Paraclostridium sordellii]|uniref:Cyclic-di-AMP phosphodiesterase n=2 Tax=Clostridia TaxID=186801 RepID=A0A9P1PB78_PARSO|nr:DHH family phosphoesterase [Paeniclostridium sordellii]EPZ61498.1 DHHA1 domain protein [[Clostridium] sordellii VPI 9048] [Paeniclostridium sordellii VPI 9048]MBX9183066.1 phosphoesterase [Paeniclostridium sordellii]MCH1967933.1 DHH family phosphoesterase [Paeniclostridium sordellii]MDU1455656.1 DHH family phosphoesterase [Paeniclostridium sordellii]MDU2688889.1 DHH family phosphoesterase [Paeniclostridium sordellii]